MGWLSSIADLAAHNFNKRCEAVQSKQVTNVRSRIQNWLNRFGLSDAAFRTARSFRVCSIFSVTCCMFAKKMLPCNHKTTQGGEDASISHNSTHLQTTRRPFAHPDTKAGYSTQYNNNTALNRIPILNTKRDLQLDHTHTVASAELRQLLLLALCAVHVRFDDDP